MARRTQSLSQSLSTVGLDFRNAGSLQSYSHLDHISKSARSKVGGHNPWRANRRFQRDQTIKLKYQLQTHATFVLLWAVSSMDPSLHSEVHPNSQWWDSFLAQDRSHSQTSVDKGERFSNHSHLVLVNCQDTSIHNDQNDWNKIYGLYYRFCGWY